MYKICFAYLILNIEDIYRYLLLYNSFVQSTKELSIAFTYSESYTKKEIYKERKVFLSLVKDCKATAQLCNARLLARNLANKLCLAVFLNLFSAAKLGT